MTDDDDAYVQMIRDVLQEAGYANVRTHVGTGGFLIIRDTQPGLVLLDINLMHPSRGWSVLDLISLHPKTRHIPVIVCSTDMRLLNEKAELLRDLGFQTLEKPFDLETLLDKVVTVIGPPPTRA